MKRLVTGALVVTGDGRSLHEGVDVLIENGRVERIAPDLPRTSADVTDARGAVVLPGLVNVHVHGVTPGPLMPSGGRPLPRWKWMENLDRHLAQGTTAVLNQCGLATMDAVRAADAAHPVHIGGATTHEPLALQAALAADGAGVTEAVRRATVGEQLAAGALAVGELGGGQTLAGGGQDVVYLPAAFRARHHVDVQPWQASLLKEAVLGRSLEWLDDAPGEAAFERVDRALDEAGLRSEVSPGEVVTLVRSVVIPSLEPALAGILEGIRLAGQHGVPAFVHSAAVTARLLTTLAQEPQHGRLVASHVNHVSYLPEEAVTLARLGREVGWVNEACVFDLIEQREMVTSREQWDAVFDAGDLVDVIATDYGPDGRHDGLLHAVRDLTARGLVSLAEAVAMVTSKPADLVPGLTPANGRLVPGGPADLVIVERDNLASVREVLVGGATVVRHAHPVYQPSVPFLSAEEFTKLESIVGTDLALQDETEVARSHHHLSGRVDEPARLDNTMTEHQVAGAATTVELIRRGALTAVEHAQEVLAAIDASQHEFRAWAHVDRQGALAAAARADEVQASGGWLGPLHGVAVGVKDVMSVAGMPMRAGSQATNDPPDSSDATAVARLRSAGAVMVGKTTTHEFASGQGDPGTRSPLHPDRHPGGSSVGSAVAVALGTVGATLATDTTGSIRNPSAANAVVGYKPSGGAVGTAGLLYFSDSLDTIGPVAPTVTDCRVVMSALLGKDLQGADPARRTRLAVVVPTASGADPGFRKVLDAALGRLSDAGVELGSSAEPPTITGR